MASYDVPARHPSARLPFSYQRLPGPLRFWLSRWLIGGAGLAAMDLGVALSADAADGAAERVVWPDGRSAAVALSHDVDTDLGVAEVAPLVALEGELGVRSTLFVPGDVLSRHESLFRGFRDEGWEIALHGARHDNRLASLEGVELERRLDAIHETAERFGLCGFRAPSFWVSEAQLTRLAAPFRYDSSVPSYRPATRLAPERGARSCRPFRVGGVLELPVAPPLDDDLLREGIPHEGFLEVWLRWIEGVTTRGGVAVFADHTEPHLSGNERARLAYGRRLERLLHDGSSWLAPLADVAAYLDPVRS